MREVAIALPREDRCGYRVERLERKSKAAAPRRHHRQRTCGGAGIGVQRVEAVPVPAQARDGSHGQSPSRQKLSAETFLLSAVVQRNKRWKRNYRERYEGTARCSGIRQVHVAHHAFRAFHHRGAVPTKCPSSAGAALTLCRESSRGRRPGTMLSMFCATACCADLCAARFASRLLILCTRERLVLDMTLVSAPAHFVQWYWRRRLAFMNRAAPHVFVEPRR